MCYIACVLRLAFEPAYGSEFTSGLRPKRSEPVKAILAWFAQNGRFNAKIDYAQSETFERATHKGDRNRTGRQRLQTAEEPLNDQTVGKFLAGLRIRLPSWQPRSLEDELARYYEQQKKKK